MSVFLGIRLGPIQTGIFLSGACRGGFDRIVVAEINPQLVQSIRKAGAILINVAGTDKLWQEIIAPIEIYNPQDPEDLKALIATAAEATEVATALPSVACFKSVADWLRRGFFMQPDLTRFVYTAENHNHAAELLEQEIGHYFANTYYLNTVIGKQSVITAMSTTPLNVARQ